jgi:hypothetical protein
MPVPKDPIKYKQWREKQRQAHLGRKVSEEIKEKIRKSLLGRKHPPEVGRKISKTNTDRIITPEWRRKISEGNKGKKLSEETKRKIGLGSKGHKYNLGHKASEETKLKMSLASKGKPKSESARQNMRKVRLGAKSHLWKGGITPINKAIRRTLQYRLWRTEIFIRDNRTCVECGAKTRDIQADHYPISFSAILNKLIVEQGLENLLEKALKYEMFWIIENGRTLCFNCHKKTFTYGINKKYL